MHADMNYLLASVEMAQEADRTGEIGLAVDIAMQIHTCSCDSTDPDVEEIHENAYGYMKTWHPAHLRQIRDIVTDMLDKHTEAGTVQDKKRRRKGTIANEKRAEANDARLIAEFGKVRKDNPTWLKGAVWDAVAKKCGGSARYMQDKFKNLPM